MGPEHLHYVPSKVITYITVRRGGPYACFISLGFQGVLPERKVRKEYFCKSSDVCSFAHLLFLWWTQPLSFQDVSPSLFLSLFLSFSPIWKLNLHISYCRALISFYLFIHFGAHHHASRYTPPGAKIVLINQSTSQAVASHQHLATIFLIIHHKQKVCELQKVSLWDVVCKWTWAYRCLLGRVWGHSASK